MNFKFLMFGLSLIIITMPFVHADTPPPDINFNITPKTIVWLASAGGGNQTLVQATTSWNPAPSTTITCTSPNCRLEIQDCNGTLLQCNNQTDGRDWNAVPGALNFEYDLTCVSNCTRFGVTEDTPFSVRLDTFRVGSRWFRACWYDTTLINCSRVVKVHAYEDQTTVPVGVSFCRPSQTGNTLIFNRTCTVDQNNNNVPLEYFVQNQLHIYNAGKLTLLGASLDYNHLSSGGSYQQRIRIEPPISTTYLRFIYAYNQKFNTYPQFTFPSGYLAVGGYSGN